MSATDERHTEIYRDFKIRIEREAKSLTPMTEEAGLALGAARLAPTWQVRRADATQGALDRIKKYIDEIWAQTDK